MDFKEKEILDMESRLKKLDTYCRGNLRALNQVRMIRLTINKAKRRDGKLRRS